MIIPIVFISRNELIVKPGGTQGALTNGGLINGICLFEFIKAKIK